MYFCALVYTLIEWKHINWGLEKVEKVIYDYYGENKVSLSFCQNGQSTHEQLDFYFKLKI